MFKDDFTDDEQKIINDHVMSETLYDAVMDQLKIAPDDADYRSIVLGVLKRQATDHMVFTIWSNLSQEQNRALRELFQQTSATAPYIRHEDVMMEFAMRYPDLLAKVHQGLSDFFQRFIAKFNEISEA